MRRKGIIFYYDHFEEIVLFIMMVIMVIVIFFQVIMRYVFNNSLSWSEELGRYIFIWLSWLGVSIGARKGGHIRIEMLADRLPFRSCQVLNIISDLIVLAICFVLVYNGVYLIDKLLMIKAKSAPLGISQAWGYAAVPVGCTIMIMRSLQSLWRSINLLRAGEHAVLEAEGSEE